MAPFKAKVISGFHSLAMTLRQTTRTSCRVKTLASISDNLEASLFLQKPLEQVDHGGGQILDPDSWQLAVLKQWIEHGAEGVSDDDAVFVRLDVSPAEIVAQKKGQTWQLKATAVWSDGTHEDVTPLCRFRTNNDQIADIDEHGFVTAKGPGDSHVVAFYDNGVVPVPVIFPVSDKTGSEYPDIKTPTPIDELVAMKLQKLGEIPSDLCSDGEFLRRGIARYHRDTPSSCRNRSVLE